MYIMATSPNILHSDQLTFTTVPGVPKKVLRLISNITTAFCLSFKISFVLDR